MNLLSNQVDPILIQTSFDSAISYNIFNDEQTNFEIQDLIMNFDEGKYLNLKSD